MWCARTESPLFNVKAYTSNLEKLLQKMWDKYVKDGKADHIID